MTTLTSATTLGQLVADYPHFTAIFEKLGLDFCCGGKRSLATACAEKGLDAATILAMLDAVASHAGSASASTDSSAALNPAPTDMTLTQLADHIEATHHAYLKAELPHLCAMADKVANAHGPRHPETLKVRAVTHNLASEMRQHMMKEEQILFPMIRQLEASATAPGAAPAFHCGSLANPIRVMEAEHDSAGGALTQLRTLTDGFVAPADACGTYRGLLAGLTQLESDLHQHVHKENNVLFPRAIELESRRRAVA